MAEVIMPKMGDAMTEGKVLRWMKHPGDTVAAGEAIAEIETDKVNVELPAEESGTLTEILAGAGAPEVGGGGGGGGGGGARRPPAPLAPAREGPRPPPSAPPRREPGAAPT